MKRYLVFARPMFYPGGGGWHDYKGSKDNLEETKKLGAYRIDAAKYHVVDTTTGTIVAEGDCDPGCGY